MSALQVIHKSENFAVLLWNADMRIGFFEFKHDNIHMKFDDGNYQIIKGEVIRQNSDMLSGPYQGRGATSADGQVPFVCFGEKSDGTYPNLLDFYSKTQTSGLLTKTTNAQENLLSRVQAISMPTLATAAELKDLETENDAILHKAQKLADAVKDDLETPLDLTEILATHKTIQDQIATWVPWAQILQSFKGDSREFQNMVEFYKSNAFVEVSKEEM